MVGSVHNKTRDGVGGSVNLFDFVTALVITRNVFQLTCVFGDFCRRIGDKGEWFELTSALIYGHRETPARGSTPH